MQNLGELLLCSSIAVCLLIHLHNCQGATTEEMSFESLLQVLQEPFRYRLVNGTSLFSGRVEVYDPVDNTWNTIDDFGFGDTEAKVLCRSLGFSGGLAHKGAYYGMGDGPVYMGSVYCRGYEHTLNDCDRLRYIYPYSGDHSKDVGVSCNGTFPLRLTEGVDQYSGTVEVFYNETWGTICDNNLYGDSNARVICRSLGFSGGSTIKSKDDDYINDTRPILLNNVMCWEIEYSLSFCRNAIPSRNQNCTHKNDLRVKCDKPRGCKRCLHKYSCNAVTDICTCERGWTGTYCDQDINECRKPYVNYCPKDTTCKNTKGSYVCQMISAQENLFTVAYVAVPMGGIIVGLLVALVVTIRAKIRTSKYCEPSTDNRRAHSETEENSCSAETRVTETTGS